MHLPRPWRWCTGGVPRVETEPWGAGGPLGAVCKRAAYPDICCIVFAAPLQSLLKLVGSSLPLFLIHMTLTGRNFPDSCLHRFFRDTQCRPLLSLIIWEYYVSWHLSVFPAFHPPAAPLRAFWKRFGSGGGCKPLRKFWNVEDCLSWRLWGGECKGGVGGERRAQSLCPGPHLCTLTLPAGQQQRAGEGLRAGSGSWVHTPACPQACRIPKLGEASAE